MKMFDRFIRMIGLAFLVLAISTAYGLVMTFLSVKVGIWVPIAVAIGLLGFGVWKMTEPDEDEE